MPQTTLFYTHQLGLQAPPITPSLSTPRASRQLSPSVPLTPNSAASTPLTVNNEGEQRVPTNPFNLHASRLPPSADQYYGCMFPIKWDDLYISGQHLL